MVIKKEHDKLPYRSKKPDADQHPVLLITSISGYGSGQRPA